jgi:hypothetical protein
VLNVGFEGLRVRGSFYGHGGAHGSLEGDRSDQGSVLAAVPWNLAVGPLSSRSPGSQARHGGVKTRLVHEYKAPSVEVGSQPPPQTPLLLPLLALRGYLRLFLSGHPPSGRAAIALPTVEVETVWPNSSSKALLCSSRVRSSLASRWWGSHSLSITPFLGGLPGIGLGSTSPLSRRLFSQRFMVGIDTEKVFAASSSLGIPASTAESTLNLRSFEYGFISRD